jgi:hypothetical protein
MATLPPKLSTATSYVVLAEKKIGPNRFAQQHDYTTDRILTAFRLNNCIFGVG